MQEEYKKKFCRVIYTSRPSRLGLLRAKIEKSLINLYGQDDL